MTNKMRKKKEKKGRRRQKKLYNFNKFIYMLISALVIISRPITLLVVLHIIMMKYEQHNSNSYLYLY